MSSVIEIENKEHLDRILQEAQRAPGGPQLVVIDFYSKFCCHCKILAPVLDEFSSRLQFIKFLKIDADAHQDVSIRYNVFKFPTLLFMRGTQVFDRISGSSMEALKDKVKEFSNLSSLVEEDHDGSIGQSLSNKHIDLGYLVAKNQCECLNEHDSFPLSQLLDSSSSESSYLLSDMDEQLIIYITFMNFVKLQSIQLNGPKSNGPKQVKLFINQISTLDFDACENGKPTQEFDLDEREIADGALINLNFVKFQNVNSLTIFIQNNQTGQDQTRIDKLKFFGYLVNTTNMNEFKRVAGKKGEAHG